MPRIAGADNVKERYIVKESFLSEVVNVVQEVTEASRWKKIGVSESPNFELFERREVVESRKQATPVLTRPRVKLEGSLSFVVGPDW